MYRGYLYNNYIYIYINLDDFLDLIILVIFKKFIEPYIRANVLVLNYADS